MWSPDLQLASLPCLYQVPGMETTQSGLNKRGTRVTENPEVELMCGVAAP